MVAEARHLPPGKYRGERRMQKDAEGGCAGDGQEQLQHFTLTNEFMYRPNQNSYSFSHGLNALGFIQFLAKHSSQVQGRGTKYFLHTSVCMHAMDNHKLLVTEPFGGICVHNAQQHQTVLDSLPSLRQTRLWLPRLKSKANEAHAKEPSGLIESFRKKIDTQKMSKGSAMSTEHSLCDSTSRGASDAVGNAIAGSPNCNNALQRTVMPPLFSAQYGPRDPSQDAFSLLKYMPWKGNLCKSKVAWAVTSRTRSSSNLAAAVAIEVPTIPNGTCLGSTQTWLVDKGVGKHLQWYCAWLPQTCCNLTLQLHPQFLCGAALRMPKPEAL